MRVLLCVLAALAVAGGVAHADDTDDEDGAFVGLPKRSMGLGFIGHGTRIGGHSEGGFGPSLEFAIGRDRWQYVGEALLSSTSMSQWTTGAVDMDTSGKMVHAAAGVRWLARQFRIDNDGGLELFLLSMLGFQRFYFDDGGRLSRPELAIGWGFQVRMYKRPRLAFHLDARIVFTPNDAESTLVACRGSCSMEEGASTGFMTGFGLSW
ncbi:MAG TPA: hypothetical protein VLB44_04000 [Kofleriaceae bacterium]|nr:hypothetical protein [Kofleriaceae bacterium]